LALVRPPRFFQRCPSCSRRNKKSSPGLHITFRVCQAAPLPDPLDAARRRWPISPVPLMESLPLQHNPGRPGYLYRGCHTSTTGRSQGFSPSQRPLAQLALLTIISGQSAHGVDRLNALSFPGSRDTSSVSIALLLLPTRAVVASENPTMNRAATSGPYSPRLAALHRNLSRTGTVTQYWRSRGFASSKL
jgi:hypothetical protein